LSTEYDERLSHSPAVHQAHVPIGPLDIERPPSRRAMSRTLLRGARVTGLVDSSRTLKPASSYSLRHAMSAEWMTEMAASDTGSITVGLAVDQDSNKEESNHWSLSSVEEAVVRDV
jgi:hypothetical protein